jgi:hypothetical protein
MSDSNHFRTRTVQIVYAVVAALAFALGQPGEAHARGDFTKSCKNIALNHSDQSSWYKRMFSDRHAPRVLLPRPQW